MDDKTPPPPPPPKLDPEDLYDFSKGNKRDDENRGRPTPSSLLSKWDYWRVSWLTLACTIIKLVTFARWMPQWDTWWKMAVIEKRTNDREAKFLTEGPVTMANQDGSALSMRRKKA